LFVLVSKSKDPTPLIYQPNENTMGDFWLYLRLGFEHITDITAYDHLLFLVALTASYSWFRWKAIAVVVTAFTIGHSITLALAATGVLRLPGNFIEFLIPLTIFITALYSLFTIKRIGSGNPSIHYPMAIIFGFIHGMGFSNYLSSLLGREESVFLPLLSFNIGIEIGQIIFVALLLALSTLVVRFTQIKFKQWAALLTLLSLLLSVYLMYQTKFW